MELLLLCLLYLHRRFTSSPRDNKIKTASSLVMSLKSMSLAWNKRWHSLVFRKFLTPLPVKTVSSKRYNLPNWAKRPSKSQTDDQSQEWNIMFTGLKVYSPLILDHPSLILHCKLGFLPSQQQQKYQFYFHLILGYQDCHSYGMPQVAHPCWTKLSCFMS